MEMGKQNFRTFLCFYKLIARCSSLHGPQREKICLRLFANNKGTDQPAHASLQSDQLLCNLHIGNNPTKTDVKHNFNFLASLCS